MKTIKTFPFNHENCIQFLAKKCNIKLNEYKNRILARKSSCVNARGIPPAASTCYAAPVGGTLSVLGPDLDLSSRPGNGYPHPLLRSGQGVPPSQVWTGGYPSQVQLGVPLCRSGWGGVPHLADRGNPLGRVPPIQTWKGHTPLT